MSHYAKPLFKAAFQRSRLSRNDMNANISLAFLATGLLSVSIAEHRLARAHNLAHTGLALGFLVGMSEAGSTTMYNHLSQEQLLWDHTVRRSILIPWL